MTTSVESALAWARLGEVPPTALTDSRLQLHHAAQIPVSAAISYIPARSDDSHTALTWSAANRALVTLPITATRVFRIGLRVEDLMLHSLDAGMSPTGSFVLQGRTSGEAHAWVASVAAEAGLDAGRLTSRKHYTIPDHPVASGAPFSLGSGTEFRELARYWSNAAAMLNGLARTIPGASEVRTWPHHFDIATLIELPGPSRRTIGIGQSPGDDSYNEPYWYVGPYPYPTTSNLPTLDGGGHWHTAGWFGAVLTASSLAAASDQRAQVLAFVESGVAACRLLLGG